MLTIFAVPKPFHGHIGDIQRNAIESWVALHPDVQVVVVGDEDGAEQAAGDAGVEHVGGLARNDRGTPRLDSAFGRTAAVARWPLWCFVNSDILLLDDFLPAIERVASAFPEFLVIGECRDVDVAAGEPTSDPVARAALREEALRAGRLRGYAALDYFVFPRGLFDPVPPFLIGRACFDNWLVWRARESGHPVVDATRAVVAVHQSHDYSHVSGGQEEAYSGAEARVNLELAGGKERIYSLHDATHRLRAQGRPVPYLGSAFRARERARRARWRFDACIAARRRRRGFQRPVRLLGIFPEPRAETTPFLDALAGSADVDLAVLYTRGASAAPSGETQSLRHGHWFPRNVRVSPIERTLGRDYPINWAIWRSLRRLRPDCVIVAGWSTFATQATVAWCLAYRVPYLLLADDGEQPSRGDAGPGQSALARAIARRADVVLVSGGTPNESILANLLGGDRLRVLPEPAKMAAASVRKLARRAWGVDGGGHGRRRASSRTTRASHG